MYIQLANLCKRIVCEYYGPIVESVASVLIRDGRLPLSLLIRYTQLSPREVRQALTVLIQHGIATHAALKDAHRIITYYSISCRNILRLQRSGLYLALVEERMGKDGLSILRTIMTNGCISFATVRDLLGFNDMSQPAKIKFNAVVAKLVRERFVVAVTLQDTSTKIDRIMQAEAKELDKMTVPPTAKELLNIRRKIGEREDEEYNSSTVIGIKRAADSEPNGNHPAKIVIGPDGRSAVIPNGHDATDVADAVDDTQCFRVYYDRLDVFLRNQQLINYFADKYNAGAGAIVKSILRVTEPHTKTCRNKASDTISASQIFQNLSPDAPIIDSVDTGSDMFYQKLGDSGVSGTNGAAHGKDTLSIAKRSEMAFALLEVVRSDSSGIIVKVDDRGAGQYRVNFERAAATLRDYCLDSLIHEKFGSMHSRIVRVLRDRQKLDEKSVSTAAMMPIASCRERLHDLVLAGFIDSVEIPRSADRNPSRMFYLWHINPKKQMQTAMRYIYQSIINVLQRLEKEISSHDLLLTKTKRDDVIADESLLTDAERKELLELANTRKRLEVACVRLDSMLLVIHDVNPEYADA
ncbi:RNA polymerase III subunit RPC82-domain-containing protein [Coemansia spiralis]|nr:RNA polymerase III subunit RPC82-domain-containing protein [Coemansia spiralis]